jgi:hypothetical protein
MRKFGLNLYLGDAFSVSDLSLLFSGFCASEYPSQGQ